MDWAETKWVQNELNRFKETKDTYRRKLKESLNKDKVRDVW